ncbi:MAG TPA: alpha/beta fold hydrolase [Actinomycetota bacterium]
MSDAMSPWVRRFTATRIGFPTWAAGAPDRLALVSNRGGSWQAWAVDLRTASWRQASDERVGVEEVLVAPDGRLVWFRDDTGAETGGWVAQAFEGGPVEPLLAGLPSGWSLGLAFGGTRVAAGLEVDGEYRIYRVDAGETRLLLATSRPCGVGADYPAGRGGLSPDGRFLALRHTDHGDILRPAIRILDAETSAVVDELDDTPRRLETAAWSPDATRLALTNELGDRARPSLWSADGTRVDLDVDLPGDVFPVDWFPDGGALLVRHELDGYGELHRLDPATGDLAVLAAPHGDLTDARVRPDGDVWFHTSDGATPPRILDLRGHEPVTSPDEPPPRGRPYRSIHATNPHGDRIHAFVVEPSGAGPFPLVLSVHGGPEWNERDAFDPETQAFVDAGYAVALPNYRGSAGYGRAHREALVGNVCWTETEDLVAVLDALVGEGTADPSRVFWSGWSWGGCLACFNAGVHPDRFRAIFAGIPAGDFVAAHWASAPELQAWDDAVYGGSPDEVPDAYARSDPMTYVEAVRSPTIIVAGEHDPRCPIEGITPWVDAVRAHGTEVEVHLYPAGHHANGMAEQVAHLAKVLAFFGRHGGVPFES